MADVPYVCECGHDGEQHTPEDDGDGFINCRYECNVKGCACEIFRVKLDG